MAIPCGKLGWRGYRQLPGFPPEVHRSWWTQRGHHGRPLSMSLDFLRRADWLNAERLRSYMWLLAAVNVATVAWLIATSHGGVDRNGFLLGTDFLSFWTSGHMLRDGADAYDQAAHIASQQRYFADGQGFTAFFYPPAFLPFCYPLGFLPYFPALTAWLLATGTGFVVTVHNWFRQFAPGKFRWTWFVAFPPVLITITHGQTAFLVATMLGMGALLVPSRPVLAGLLLGTAVIKPQLGLMVPLVLVMTGQSRVIVAAVASAVGLSLLATWAFGPSIWHGWLAGMAPAQLSLENGQIGYAKLQSVFAAAMLVGASVRTAYALQALLTLCVAAALVWTSWRRRYDPLLGAAMLVGSLLATPFMLDYDLVLLAFPLIVLAGRGKVPWVKIVAALAFIAPAFARPIALVSSIPIMSPVLLALFAVLLAEARRGRADHTGTTSAHFANF
jgi:hypothetical protein